MTGGRAALSVVPTVGGRRSQLDNEVLFVASQLSKGTEEGLLCAVEPSSGRTLARLHVPDATVMCATVSEDGRRLWIGDWNGRVIEVAPAGFGQCGGAADDDIYS